MELRDLVVTPIWLIIILVGAVLVRTRIKDPLIRPYFLPALIVRLIGAVAVGMVYQFYYGGGDTFNFHTYGSRIIWEAAMEDPMAGLNLFFQTSAADYARAQKILFYHDPASFALIRIIAIVDLLTFSSYSATALLFGLISFGGAWALFLAFYRLHPELHKPLAFATLFVPSVFFWGSGILKDTITLAALGFLVFGLFSIFVHHRPGFFSVAGVLVSAAIIAAIKIYILLTFLPCVIVVLGLLQLRKFKFWVTRALVTPVVLAASAILVYFAATRATAENPKYNISQLAETARVTAMDIRYYTGKNAGSGYDLGVLDGTWESIVRLAPAAINVALFRPYLWEVKNPLMALSALETAVMLMLTLYFLLKYHLHAIRAMADPLVLFCLLFSLSFALAVGVSTYNFGTLNRYKIPLIPFYLVFIVLLSRGLKKPQKILTGSAG
jgi:hypothetical protein